MRRLVVSLAVATLILSTGGAAFASPGDLLLVSASKAGVKANDESLTRAISSNGNFVAFSTVATNLDSRDTDLDRDVYVKDLTTGEVVLASTSAGGVKGNGASDFPSFSADGTKVAFSSTSTNLSPQASAGIFVKDLTTGQIVLASTSVTGRPDFGIFPSLSADAGRVAFQSESTVLHPGDTDELTDVYVKDLRTGDLVLASTSDAGVKGVGGLFGSRRPLLSADGTRVGFLSDDVNLDPADRDEVADSYVKDLATGDLTLISTSDTGVKGNDVSGRPTLSADA
jgi:Tol biopolymer transport system component